MTHDELRELTGGYALGMLSDDEKRALEAHLAACVECAREVREFGLVTSGLAGAVPQVDPPAALRARVLRAAVAGQPASFDRAPGTLTDEAAGHRVETRVRPSMLPAWLAAVAAIAAIALGLYAMTLRERIGQLEVQLREANFRAEGAQRELQIARAGDTQSQRIGLILDAPDVRTIDLVGLKGAPKASGRAFWSPSRGLVFTASHLPEPAAGRQYQLWMIPRGSTTPVSAGMLDFAATGPTMAVVSSGASAQLGTVAVTLEPTGGRPAPSTEPVLAGSW